MLVKNFQSAEQTRTEFKSALQARQMNGHLKNIIAKESEQERTTYYTQKLEATYARIERLEEKEKNMMNNLQTTMKEHNMLQVSEK